MAKTIPLSRGLVAIVDDEDYELLISMAPWNVHTDKQRRHHYAKRGSVGPSGRQTTIFMHRFLTGWPLVDHINSNGLDNRRANLRSATSSQNAMNRRKQAGSSSGYKGISWHKNRHKWQASIGIAGKRVHLGMHSSPVDAALAYDLAAVKAFGEFARINFPLAQHPGS